MHSTDFSDPSPYFTQLFKSFFKHKHQIDSPYPSLTFHHHALIFRRLIRREDCEWEDVETSDVSSAEEEEEEEEEEGSNDDAAMDTDRAPEGGDQEVSCFEFE